MRRPYISYAVTGFYALASGACVTSSTAMRSADGPPAHITSPTNYFDASRIRRSGASTAWDALRFLAPHHRLGETGPLGVSRPLTAVGSGVAGLPAARVILDGLAVPDPSALRALPASDIIDIRLVGVMEALTYFGPGYGGGVVVIRTTHGSRTVVDRR